jgi:polyisoprenoid-binding protein YceI
MKKLLLTIAIINVALWSQAQSYFTKNATISFVNKSTVETIEATNKAVTTVIDAKTGALAFSVQIKSFTFSKALMQQHFNDNYMESGKFPKAEFKGTITNNADVKYTVDGTYTAKVTGKLTMHGVTKDVSTTGKIVVKGGKVSATASFTVTLSDYKIKDDKIGKTTTINIATNDLTKK